MTYDEYIEDFWDLPQAKQEGHLNGFLEGFLEGLQEGYLESALKNLRDAIVLVAQARFRSVPESLHEKIYSVHEPKILYSLLVSLASLDKRKGAVALERMIVSSMHR